MADTQFGTPRLRVENQAHNNLDGSRRRSISEQQDSIFVSSLVREGETLAAWPTIYLVVFVDLDQNDEAGVQEFERLELDFVK